MTCPLAPSAVPATCADRKQQGHVTWWKSATEKVLFVRRMFSFKTALSVVHTRCELTAIIFLWIKLKSNKLIH